LLFSLAAAFALIATPALAQPQTPAQQLIAEAHAEGVFEEVPSLPRSYSVRHIQSGLVCHFPLEGSQSRLVIMTEVARGEGVTCNGDMGDTTWVIVALHMQIAPTIEETMPLIADRCTGETSSVEQLPPFDAAPPDMAPTLTSRYVITTASGARRYCQLSHAVVDGWTIVLRLLGPADYAEGRGREASEAFWYLTLGSFQSEAP
jgi:hypothetical protein